MTGIKHGLKSCKEAEITLKKLFGISIPKCLNRENYVKAATPTKHKRLLLQKRIFVLLVGSDNSFALRARR
jgi:hypothetical protein